MTIVIIIALAIVGFVIFSVVKQGGDDSPDLRHKQLDPRNSDRDDDYDHVWKTREFFYSHNRKALGVTLLPGFNDISLAGVNSFQENCARFIMDADERNAMIDLVREHNNPNDPNAMAVYGTTKLGAERVQIGYLPAKKAKEFTETYTDEMPIQGELRKGGVHRDEDAVFITINVTSPPAAKRKKYLVGPS